MSPSPAQLPEDIICCGILPRLPVRSLARFATVCKAWRDLILRDAVFPTLQAQSPSRASTALARFHNGRLEVLNPGAAAYVAPPYPSLSFAGYHGPELGACAGGLLCLTAVQITTWLPVFFVGNLATRRFHKIPYGGCPLGVPGLAYDPAAPAPARGYHVVVAARYGMQTCRFFRFSSRAAGSGWREARDTARLLAPFEVIQPKPAYAGGRLHWLTDRGNVVWHDVASELSGALRPPRDSDGRRHLHGNMDLAAWRGRVRLACAATAGLGVWELASYGGGKAEARWELVHWRSWCAIPGVAGPERCFLWSVVPAGMEAGGEEALGLALRYAHTRLVDVDGMAVEQDVWCRVLARYETRTGATAAAVGLSGKEVHDYFGTVFSYHSSLAPLPCLNMDA